MMMINRYELVTILDSKLTPEEKEKIYREATEAVSKGSGKVINAQVWLDKHKFTFKIKRRTEGTYYLINFEADGSAIQKIREALRLNENILRHAIIKATQ
jgi:small subunit ribosomal protein S6